MTSSPERSEVTAADLDQVALDCLQQVTTVLYTVTMPLAQRHAKAQNAIRDALAAVRADADQQAEYSMLWRARAQDAEARVAALEAELRAARELLAEAIPIMETLVRQAQE